MSTKTYLVLTPFLYVPAMIVVTAWWCLFQPTSWRDFVATVLILLYSVLFDAARTTRKTILAELNSRS